MQLLQYDIEILILILILIIIFIAGLKKVPSSIPVKKRIFAIDISMSQSIKGIACVFILMAHWIAMRGMPCADKSISRCVFLFSANIALTWFMFFSGYGMSLKSIVLGEHRKKWFSSLKKIYIPCLIVNTFAFVLYAMLCNIFYEDILNYKLNPNIYRLQHLAESNIIPLIKSFILANGSWYVICIIIFLFYILLIIIHST